MEALAATAIIGLVLAAVCWLAWLILTDKATEAKSALLRQYVEILRQLENIAELEKEFNALCAGQSLGKRLDVELIEQAVALIKADFDEIEISPAWKVLGRYPKYWHHAEIHARCFAPMEGQLRDSIAELEHATAH